MLHFLKLLFLFLCFLSFQSCLSVCDPSCRAGFTCVSAECVTKCNPECDSDQTCSDDGQCESTSACDPACGDTETCNETTGECEASSASLNEKEFDEEYEEEFEQDDERQDDTQSDKEEDINKDNFEWEESRLPFTQIISYQVTQLLDFGRNTFDILPLNLSKQRGIPQTLKPKAKLSAK